MAYISLPAAARLQRLQKRCKADPAAQFYSAAEALALELSVQQTPPTKIAKCLVHPVSLVPSRIATTISGCLVVFCIARGDRMSMLKR